MTAEIMRDHVAKLSVETADQLTTRDVHELCDAAEEAILAGGGTNKPKLEYLPDGYIFEDGVTVFASGKDGIFAAGTPIGKTTAEGEVDLFVDANQLSFVTVILTYQKKEKF